MNSIKDDVGIQTIQDIYSTMQIDEEWSIETERGFTWWASQFKQTMWADQPVTPAQGSDSLSTVVTLAPRA